MDFSILSLLQNVLEAMIGWRDLRAPLLIFGRGIDVLMTPRCVMDSSIVRVKKMRTRTNAYFIKR